MGVVSRVKQNLPVVMIARLPLFAPMGAAVIGQEKQGRPALTVVRVVIMIHNATPYAKQRQTVPSIVRRR